MADRKPYIYAPRLPDLIRPSMQLPTLGQMPQRPQLYSPRIVTPYSPKPSTLFDYNDPYQINSIADVILTTFNKDMKRRSFNIGGVDISEVPILNIIPSLFQFTEDAYIKPIMEGNWLDVGLNTLNNFSETLDIFANPVKGLVQEGGTGFVNALGWGSEGRKNYDYNTGNFVADMALELVSDPLNWVTLFGKGAITTSLKQLTRAGIRDLAQETGQELAEKAYKTLTKQIVSTFMEGGDESLAKIARESAEAMMRKGAKAPVEFTEAFLKGLDKFALDDTTVNVIKGINSFIKPVEAIDSTLTKLGVGAPYAAGYLVKKTGNAVWEYLHSGYLRGLKQFMTPEGNLDILKMDEIMDYTKRYHQTTKELQNAAGEFPTNDLAEAYVKEGLLKETSDITHFLKTDLKNIPNANMESKVKLFQEYIQKQLGLDPAYALSIVQDINNKSGLEYQWLYSWMRTYLDEDGAKLIDQRKGIWDMYHDLSDQIKKLKGVDSPDKLNVFEQYLKEKYGLTTEEWLKQADNYELILGKDFSWIKDYYSNTLQNFEMAPGYAKRREITNKVWELLRDPEDLKGETRLKLLNDFIKNTHNVDIDTYLAKLKELDTKFPGVFTDFINKFELQIEQLKLIDKLSKENAVKRAMAETMKINNDLVKEQQDMLVAIPQRAKVVSQKFLSDFIDQSKGLLKDKDAAVLEEFLNQSKGDFYADMTRVFSDATRLIKEGAPGNELYEKSIAQLREITNGYWNTLEKTVRKQFQKDVSKFNIESVFKPLSDRIDKYLEKIIPNLKEYHDVIAKADALNKITTYDAFLKSNVAAFQENYEKLINFIGLNNKAMHHLSDKIIRIERTASLTLENFQKVQKDFTKDLYGFFSTGKKPKTWNDLITNWLVSLGKPGGTRTIPKIYHEAFLESFDDLLRAIKKEDFSDFLTTAEEIMYNVKLISLQSNEVAATVRPLYDIFAKYGIAEYKPFMANIAGEEVWYHFKLEQDYVLGLMMTNKDVNDFMKELLDASSELGGMLKNKIIDKDPAAVLLLDSLNSYMNYRNFLNNLYEFIGNPETLKDSIDHDLLGAFQSTLQKYAMLDPKSLTENFENVFYHIIQQTEQQINTMQMTKNLSLDELVKTLEKDPKYADALKGLEEHHAADDAVRNYYVVQSELEGEFQKLYGDDIKVLYLDIETTGLDGTIDELTEIGMHSPELNINKYGEVYDPKDIGQARAFPAQTKRPATVQTEFEILQRLMQKLEPLKGQKIVINMHNGFAFDRRFLIHRFEHYANLFKNDPKLFEFCTNSLATLKSSVMFKYSDSLKMLEAKYGYTTVSESDRFNLYSFLRTFLNEQQGMDKFIQPLDPTIARQLKYMGQTLMEDLGKEGAERYAKYFDASRMIYEVFKDFKTANRELSRTLLSKTVFRDGAFQKIFGALNITQALNTKVIYNNTGEITGHEIIDGIKQFGVKKHLDEMAIREYFDESTYMTEAEMLYRTNIAKDIDREYKQLRHSTRLKNVEKEMQDALRSFIEKARESTKVPEALMHLKVHTDYRSNFAILRKLFTYRSEAFEGIVKNVKGEFADNLLDGIVPEKITGELRSLLELPTNVRCRVFVDDGSISKAVDLEIQKLIDEKRAITGAAWEAKKAELKAAETEAQFQEYLTRVGQEDVRNTKTEIYRATTVSEFEKHLELKDDLLEYSGYYKAIKDTTDDYKDIMDILDNLAQAWDTNGASRAVIQVRATSLKGVYNMLEAAKTRHASIKNMDKQYHQIMKYHRVLTNLNWQQMDMALNLSDDDLFAHLVNDARRVIAFDGYGLPGESVAKILERQEALETKGIHTILKDNKIFWVLDKDIKISTFTDDMGKTYHLVDGKKILPPRLTPLNVDAALELLDEVEDTELKRAIKEVYAKLYKLVGDYDSDYSPHYGSTGEVTSKLYYTGSVSKDGTVNSGVYDMFPDEVRELLPHKDIMYADEFFHGATFNHSILGDANFRREFHQYTNSDIISMLTGSMTQQAQHLKAHLEYMNMFFDKSLSIGNGGLKDFSDETLLQALKNSDEYRLVALVQDAKKGAKVVDLDPQNIMDIKKAKELNAVLMSYQTYSTAFGAINSFGIRHSKLNWLHKINYLYKMGFLMTPGALMRNVIDSVSKNYIVASDDPSGMTQAFLSAFQMYWKYRKTARELIEYSKDAATGTSRITKQSTKEYFESGASPLTKELYDFVHGFDVDGPSGGVIKEFEQYFRHGKELGPYGTITQLLDTMMHPNNVVEQIVRLAEYTWAIEKGLTNTKAFALIAKTHFDYTIKTDMQRLIELIFPFYTFTMNNIHFWLDAFDKVPALGSVLRDVSTPVWNFDEYSHEELQYNKSLQYQVLSGNLPLERIFGDSAHNMTLKMNPSYMDLFSLITNPVNTILGKLHPVAQAGVGLAGANIPEEMKFAYGINTPSVSTPEEAAQSILELLPIAGPIINRMVNQAPKYYERTGNMLNLILPSMFGATAESKVFPKYQPKAYHTFRSYPKKPRRGYYKRPRKYRAKKYYGKRFFSKMQRYYPKKVYSSVGYSIDNFYNKLYTKTGKSRLALRTIPVTGQTLKYRLKDMFYYYK